MDQNVAGFATLAAQSGLSSSLIDLLMADQIVPGSPPSYELCKTIFSYHPLGQMLADAPITRAQAKPRDISIPSMAEERLVEQYVKEWNRLGQIGGTMILHNLFSISRMYGIASLAVGERGHDSATPFDIARAAKADLYFNLLDPLNTAGNLVLNQDPNAPDFLKPRGTMHISGQAWHPSRMFVKMNEQPIYIEWTSSAFGFVGRSVYQRALYLLKSFLQSMVTDFLVTQKAGLIVYKAESPGNFIDNMVQGFFGQKRSMIKAGVTGQVLSIGIDEAIETLNMQNLDKAFTTARTDILKNLASACGMPASIIAQETLTEGFGEGTEDFKKEVEYLDKFREEMNPAYHFLDRICLRKAFTPEFFEALRADVKEYRNVSFEQFFYEVQRSFKALWPNLLSEPDSEKVKTEEIQFKSVVALVEVMFDSLDPEHKAKLMAWAADNVNDRAKLFSGVLDIDQDALETYFSENRDLEKEQMKEPAAPRPFSQAS